MNKDLRNEVVHLRAFNSQESAVNWVISTYPPGEGSNGHVMTLISHMSWNRNSQIQLAKAYLPCAFPSGISRALDVFGSFMAVPKLCNILWDSVKEKPEDMDMLAYHLRPSLSKYAKSESSAEAIETLYQKLVVGD